MSNLMVATAAFPVTLVTTAETVVAVTPQFNEDQQSTTAEGIALWGVVNVSAGTGATSLILRVRQGNGLNGPIVQGGQPQGVVSTQASYPFAANDPAILQQGAQYTLTAQQVGATGNGTVNGGAFFNHDADSFE